MTSYRKFTVSIRPALRQRSCPNKVLMLPLLACTISFVFVLFFATPAQAHSIPTPNTPTNSFAFEGLLPDHLLCGDGYRIADTDLCTHGPDSPPPGFEIHTNDPAVAEQPLTPKAILCDGDGSSGKRVQVMYVRTEDQPDRYAQSRAAIRTAAAATDTIFEVSAQETGGHRHIRFVTDAHCQIDVLNIVIPPLTDSSFRSSILTVKAQGYDRRDRKYIMFVDANVYCGMATVLNDERPSTDNSSNILTGYAPPIVNLFALAAEPGLITPATITITAQVSNSEGILAKVEFYDGPTLLEVDTTSPYLYAWKGVTSGTYIATAKVYDDMDTLITSSMLTLIVPEATAPPINSKDEQPTLAQLYLPLIMQ